MKNYLCIALLAVICNLQAMQERTYTRDQVKQILEAMEHFREKLSKYEGRGSVEEHNTYYTKHRFEQNMTDTHPDILLGYYQNVVVPSRPQPFDQQRVIQSIKAQLSRGKPYFADILRSYGIDPDNLEKATRANLGLFFEKEMNEKYSN